METFKNLTILGTSHIALQSVKEVEKLLIEKKPSIIALELDKKRLYALMAKKRQKPSLKDIKILGIRGFILNIIGAWIEQKLGKMVGVAPGTEMKTAVKLSKKLNSKIALIDQDISVTLKKLIKRLTLKEHLTFLYDLIMGLIFRKKVEIAQFDLRQVPSEKIIKKLVQNVKKKYPSIYKTLILERNDIMAKNLYKLITHYQSEEIVAIVGAGHEKSILKIVQKKVFEQGG